MQNTKKKFLSNVSWLISGSVIRLVISLIVSILTARFLGPSNYGKISYIASFCSFFTSLCTLGINSIIVKELIDHKDRQGEVLGSTLAMRMVSTILSMCANCFLIYLLNPDDKLMHLLAFIQSFYLFFSVFDSLNYWFQSRLESKVTAIIATVGYGVMAIYRVILLLTEKSVVWFAAATSLDTAVIAILLIICYFKTGGQKFTYSWIMCKQLLSKSKHYILSGLMVSLYAQMDKTMINEMIDATAVGYYTTASAINGMWTFVIAAIVDSSSPLLYDLYNTNKEKFRANLRNLYAAVIWICVLAALGIMLLAKPIIFILYGSAYEASIPILQVVVWSSLFSYLGVAKNIWIVCENKNKYLLLFTAMGVVGNVALNLLLIPLYGALGAAIATVITQIITSVIGQYMVKATRENGKLILEAFVLKGILTKNNLTKMIRKIKK